MTPIPKSFRKTFLDVEAASIDGWWSGLTDEMRREVAVLCDERQDSCFFGVVDDLEAADVPSVAGGRFVQQDEDGEVREWEADYFDYLANNPELVILWDRVVARFYFTCTRHPSAQACTRAGTVPIDFACPFDQDDACLMKPLRGRRLLRRRITSHCSGPGGRRSPSDSKAARRPPGR